MPELSLSRRRTPAWLWALFAGLLVALSLNTLPALAQDENTEATEAAPSEEPTAEEGTAKTEEGSSEGEGEGNFLWWVIHTSGWIGAVILVLSIYFVATVIRLFMDFRQDVAMPPDVVAQVEQNIQRKDFMAIYKLVKETPCFFCNVLRAGISELQNGVAEAREAMDRTGEAETVEMEKRISMLAVLGSLGPMIGLLGTLSGMIKSFSAISMSGEGQLNAGEVAGGISEALLLTFEGVGLSVPAIYFFAVFKNRLSTIAANTMLASDEVLRRIYGAAKKGGTEG
jgi:biopolymer transport protein ExbB